MGETKLRIVAYVRAYVDAEGEPPTIQEICDHLGLTSKSTVHTHLRGLVLSGHLRQTRRGNYTIPREG